MGCWHGPGYGHGCGPGHYWPPPRGWYAPVDEDEWYEDVNWPMRRRARGRPVDPELRAASLETRLEELREELRRVEAALADLARSPSGSPSE
jgi:hypothetical protein